MIPKINKNSLFLIKYLGNYALLLLIPLLLLGSLIFYVYLDVLKKEIVKNNISLVEIHRNAIDKEFRQIYSIYYQLFADSSFSKMQIQENPIHVVETLSNYDSMNDMTREIIVYPRGDRILYSSNGTQSIKSFLDGADVFKDWDERMFTEKINSVDKPVIKPAVNTGEGNTAVSGKYVSFMLPLPPESKNPDRTVIFLMDHLKMLSLLGSAVAEKEEDFILLDSDKTVICSLRGSDYGTSAEYKAFVDQARPGKIISGTVDMAHMEYFISCTVSDTTGIYYIRLMPEKQALSQLYYVRDVFFYTSLLIFVIGGVVILLNLLQNINPLTQLMHLSERMMGNTKAGSSRASSIKKAVGDVVKTYDKLEFQLNKSIPAVKEHILGKILQGSADEADIGNLPDRGFFADTAAKCYFTAVINILKPVSLHGLPIAEIVKDLEGLLVDGMAGYCKPATDVKKLILLLSADEGSNVAIEDNLSRLRSLLHEKFSLETVVGVGNVYENLADIGKSFIEANSALDYRLVQGADPIIFWSNISRHGFENTLWYPKAELEKLENFILQWDSQKIEETVHEILKTVRDQKIPLSIAKCISYDIINTAFRGLSRINPSLDPHASIHLNIFSLTEVDTLDELFDRIVSISKEINVFMLHNNQASSRQLIHSIFEYLHKNCFRYDFTVEGMSEYFSLSPAYLRRVFKEATHSTILSYANTLRIEKAKELLKDTDLGLGEVVKNIGYLDTSSFVRKFKQETGVTPGDFKKINKKV